MVKAWAREPSGRSAGRKLTDKRGWYPVTREAPTPPLPMARPGLARSRGWVTLCRRVLRRRPPMVGGRFFRWWGGVRTRMGFRWTSAGTRMEFGWNPLETGHRGPCTHFDHCYPRRSSFCGASPRWSGAAFFAGGVARRATAARLTCPVQLVLGSSGWTRRLIPPVFFFGGVALHARAACYH